LGVTLLGFLLPTVLVVIYFLKREAFGDPFYTLFVFNPDYQRSIISGAIESNWVWIDVPPVDFCSKYKLAALPALLVFFQLKGRGNV
jgi:hypothetical protein